LRGSIRFARAAKPDTERGRAGESTEGIPGGQKAGCEASERDGKTITVCLRVRQSREVDNETRIWSYHRPCRISR